MPDFGVVAYHGLIIDSALRAYSVGGVLDLPRQRLRARQAEDVLQAVGLAPRHRFGPRIMAVAPEQDAGLWPAGPDTADEAPDVGPHLHAGRRLARAQYHGDGTAALGIVDVDGQEAAFVIMGVEQRQLLMAVDDVAGIVDVQRHRLWLPRVGVHPGVYQRVGEADHVAQARGIFQSRQGRLRAQVGPGVGQTSAGELEGWIGAQGVEIVAILVAAADREDAGPDHVGEAVDDSGRIAAVRDQAGQPLGNPEAPLRERQQHDTPVRREATAVESGCDFLAIDGWKAEARGRIVDHGGRGRA